MLGKIRYLGDTFVIEKSGDPIARMTPLEGASTVTLREALAAWRQAGEPDDEFADDLERVNSADRPPETPWDS